MHSSRSERGSRSWRGRGHYACKVVVGDEERPRDVKWLTCFILSVVSASCAGL